MKVRGEVLAVCLSPEKGTKKRPIEVGYFRTDYGLIGDGHAEEGGLRQVSLLSEDSILYMRGFGLEVGPGDFAENLTIRGMKVSDLKPGTRLRVGEVVLEVTQIGKECHSRCAIYRQVGDCIMPREGVFARVIKGGQVRPGDEVEVLSE